MPRSKKSDDAVNGAVTTRDPVQSGTPFGAPPPMYLRRDSLKACDVVCLSVRPPCDCFRSPKLAELHVQWCPADTFTSDHLPRNVATTTVRSSSAGFPPANKRFSSSHEAMRSPEVRAKIRIIRPSQTGT